MAAKSLETPVVNLVDAQQRNLHSGQMASDDSTTEGSTETSSHFNAAVPPPQPGSVAEAASEIDRDENPLDVLIRVGRDYFN